MRYIHRDKNGKLMGHYANPQYDLAGVGYALEEAPDDHPDIVAFKQIRLDAQKAKAKAAEDAKRKAEVASEQMEKRIAELEAAITKLMKGK